MTDILETIDRLYAKAEKANTGGPAAAYEAAMLELHSALVGNWPAVRDRLREAERKAKALDLIASGVLVAKRCLLDENANKPTWVVSVDAYQTWHSGDDLLTAIEVAMREAQP